MERKLFELGEHGAYGCRIRKILYGGLRFTTPIVLQKQYWNVTYVPTDAHSWAKYYNGADLNKLTPYNYRRRPHAMCNTTEAASSGTFAKCYRMRPLYVSAKGNFSLWAGQ